MSPATGVFVRQPGIVCATGATGDDRTLCGLAFDVGVTDEPGLGEWKESQIPRPVNCEDCDRIIRHCVSFRLARRTAERDL